MSENFGKTARAVAFVSMLGAVALAPAHAADGDKMQSFDTWATQAAGQYNGRIPRQVYLDEMGRRWEANPNRQGSRAEYLDELGRQYDQLDVKRQGLSPAEASRITGNVDTSAGPAKSGSGVQPGNMGPGSAKGQ
jgi:hypothetical protein